MHQRLFKITQQQCKCFQQSTIKKQTIIQYAFVSQLETKTLEKIGYMKNFLPQKQQKNLKISLKKSKIASQDNLTEILSLQIFDKNNNNADQFSFASINKQIGKLRKQTKKQSKFFQKLQSKNNTSNLNISRINKFIQPSTKISTAIQTDDITNVQPINIPQNLSKTNKRQNSYMLQVPIIKVSQVQESLNPENSENPQIKQPRGSMKLQLKLSDSKRKFSMMPQVESMQFESQISENQVISGRSQKKQFNSDQHPNEETLNLLPLKVSEIVDSKIIEFYIKNL